MNIRALFPRDLDKVRAIHEKYYDKEFSFDEFNRKFLGSFIVVEDDTVIAAGGVRSIAESVIVTNKYINPRKRVDALSLVYDASKYIAKNSGHNALHAFIQDEHWYDQLCRFGFRPTIGLPLYHELD